ncbi:hypothetical protein [Microbulbifer sp. GL-2]|uniref:hypothetical protein n=1 Tax=Microbulbifer sp. GL-2 TaxID=2591606 RepID=UPI001164B33A|nr:hypothetical protein [Microbulbifer sp. GL-2]BBM02900.1 hypothetical protein GL2_29740 [Microbulbifer sp. GL-2]
MSSFYLTSVENVIQLAPAQVEADIESYQISQKRGTLSGVGITVSGAGAWAKLDGSFSFKIMSLETSRSYQEIKTTQSISAGVSAFWGWLGVGANASVYKEELNTMFKEIQTSQEVEGHVNLSMEVSGIYPNVAVSASAYVFVLQVTDSSGNTFNIASHGNPGEDTGAYDTNTGNTLPDRNNDSVITL